MITSHHLLSGSLTFVNPLTPKTDSYLDQNLFPHLLCWSPRLPPSGQGQVRPFGTARGRVRVRPGELPPRLGTCLGNLWLVVAHGPFPGGGRNRAMEDPLGTRESRTRPRERDPDRRPHPNRDRHVERPRDRAGDRHRERNGDVRGNGDRRAGRERRTDRDPRQDGHRDAGHRAAEQRAWDRPRQSRARPEPWVPSWDTAPTPRPAPWGGPEPPRKQGLGRRGLDR